MNNIDSKVLESLMIITESEIPNLSKLPEDKYNKYFLNLKTECFRILKQVVNDYNKENPSNVLKVIPGTGYKTGEKFYPRFIDYNEIPIGAIQRDKNGAIDKIESIFNNIVNNQYSELINNKTIYFKFEYYGVNLYFKKYAINDSEFNKYVAELTKQINNQISILQYKLTTYSVQKNNTFTKLEVMSVKHKLKKLEGLIKNISKDNTNDINFELSSINMYIVKFSDPVMTLNYQDILNKTKELLKLVNK